MPEPYMLFRRLAPAEALQMLADGAETTGSAVLEGVLIQIGQTTLTPVTIAAPAPPRRRQQHPTNALIAAYNNMGKEGIQQENVAPQDYFPAAEGIARMVLNGGYEERAMHVADEYLLIGRVLDRSRAQEILMQLARFATHVQVAAGVGPQGNHYVYHVRDDRERASAFAAVLAAGYVSDCSLLETYISEDARVFLPPQSTPGRAALAQFSRLVKHTPQFFGISDSYHGHDLLVALDELPAPQDVPGTTGTQLDMLYLGNLLFKNQVDLDAQLERYAGVNVYGLIETEERLEQLREAIYDQAQRIRRPVGYRLELRRTRLVNDIQVQRVRLLQQQTAIERELAYLDSIEPPRPELLRFTQAQLPVLGDYLRTFPRWVIEQGLLQYAFQASEVYPEGVHFILIDPRYAPKEQMDTLPKWDTFPDQPIQFWLDPFWSHYYLEGGHDCLVFVPRQMALFPAMHPWEPDEIDVYLRSILGQWFHGEHGTIAIPEQPIYIFDGKPDPQALVSITVLDRAQFQPLYTQLDWLNDNLVFVSTTVASQDLLQEIAAGRTLKSIADHVAAGADSARDILEREAQATVDHIAATTRELGQLLNEAVTHYLDESVRTAENLRETRRRLDSLARYHREMKQLADQGTTSVAQTQKLVDAVDDMTGHLALVVNSKLDAAEAERNRQELRVSAMITHLQRLHDDLAVRVEQLRTTTRI